MAGVAILHAADKEAAAARLADAVLASGFPASAVAISDPAGLADAVEGCAADVRILIWSRPLVSHALHSGELRRIRQLPDLIEVSADGIAPPSRGDDARVVSISGWRGQPFHPGWQRIQTELKRLCGPREAVQRPAAAANPRSHRPAAAARSGGSRPHARRLLLGGGGAAVLLVAAAVGAANWLDESPPDAPPPREIREAERPAPIAPAPRPATEPMSSNAPATASPVPQPSAPPSPERPAAAKAEADAAQARPASRPSAPKAAARPRPQPSSRTEPVKKYSRKNSKVMRQFCEGAGRSTPQCRTFQRSLRDRGAGDSD